jgi:putative SOS response-associated peptidase YedK
MPAWKTDMCNLYSITTNQAAISALFRIVNRYAGNLAPMPGVFPDYKAPIVRTGAEGRELAAAKRGVPSSSMALMDATKKRAEKLRAKGKPVDFKELLWMEPDGGTTNIRNVRRARLGVENRCVVSSPSPPDRPLRCTY